MSTLRHGFTTGTAAAAAAKAALLLLLHGRAVSRVDVPLPCPHAGERTGTSQNRTEPSAPGSNQRLTIAVLRCMPEENGARAVVVKDAGDDPDVTHGAEIHALVHWHPDNGPGNKFRLDLDGGPGVGRVTLPGLAVPVGDAAINPGPREQIESAVAEALDGRSGAVRVRIEVPAGRKLARRTMNPRLGIVDGISILGTHGIVRPFSHAAWAASVSKALDVIRAQGHGFVVFTTGRKSERLYREVFPRVPGRCLVQAADFFGHAMRAAAKRNFLQVDWSLFFGKLVKQAQGFENTHAHEADIDFAALARRVADAGAAPELIRETAQANTARQVLTMLRQEAPTPVLAALLEELVRRAETQAQKYGPGLRVRYAVFDFDGRALRLPPGSESARTSETEKLG